jgi:hypothetical protein
MNLVYVALLSMISLAGGWVHFIMCTVALERELKYHKAKTLFFRKTRAWTQIVWFLRFHNTHITGGKCCGGVFAPPHKHSPTTKTLVYRLEGLGLQPFNTATKRSSHIRWVHPYRIMFPRLIGLRMCQVRPSEHHPDSGNIVRKYD